MLPQPKFFDTPSEARAAVKRTLLERRVAHSVNDILTRVDPDVGKWFGIVVLDTDSEATLRMARKCLPEFRVIGELFPISRRSDTRASA
jgi:hypothetical protein